MNHLGQIILGLVSICMVVTLNIYFSTLNQISISLTMISCMFIALSWGLGKYIDMLRYKIEFDSLTNAYSRTVAVKRYRKLMRRAKRTNGAVAVYFIDVDHFKQINDNYGHNTGDKMLRKVADRLLQLRIPEKVVVRWGGDEFVVMVPCQCEHEVWAFYHLMDKSIQSISYQGNIQLSLSIGTAVSSHVGARPKQLEQLVELADKQMLWNKRRKKYETTLVSRHTAIGGQYRNLCR
ncbi:GGDEF domain-containing protein [Paenibacillus sp. SC116]|uniref:GGDEF domain-containing protein n=1 Tax=Paenibacillus sp. SC116 TaxID=2968986 RepID=UPI00215AA7E0|nr:GGDEF domain-containing protein [Paenibacillus sp. SC116]MCR8842284.1 GGDEF domain-containing protein [Paenibacillus sp. SC116]